MRDSLAYHADDLRLIPLLLPGAAFPEKQSELPACLRARAWQRLTHADDEKDRQNLAAAIRGIRQQEQARPIPDGVCPFRGLEAFRESDQHLFFGREVVTQRITEYLAEHAFMAVLGPSGSGKSSVVQAGVMPYLRERNNALILFTPTHRPLEELAFALRTLFHEADAEQPKEPLMNRLRGSPDTLYFLACEVLERNAKKRLFLIIDQFEEIFTLTEDPRERLAFLACLSHAVDHADGRVSVVLTMRSDFLGRCVAHPNINNLITEHFLQVAPMNHEELAQAIESPARLAGLTLEPGLLERVLHDVAGASGELPLLEHALLELYERRREGTLIQSAYDEIGGIDGALARRAESAYQDLSPDEREVLRKMFVLCLVHPGEATGDTRRRTTREELRAVGSDAMTMTMVQGVLERWTDLRLLTTNRDEVRGLESIEVAHEALIRCWNRIGEWMEQGRETVRLLNRLRQHARTWDESGRDDDHLLRGGPLHRMEELVAQEADHVGAREKAFVAAGTGKSRRAMFIRGLLSAFGFVLALLAFGMFLRSNRQRTWSSWKRRVLKMR